MKNPLLEAGGTGQSSKTTLFGLKIPLLLFVFFSLVKARGRSTELEDILWHLSWLDLSASAELTMLVKATGTLQRLSLMSTMVSVCSWHGAASENDFPFGK